MEARPSPATSSRFPPAQMDPPSSRSQLPPHQIRSHLIQPLLPNERQFPSNSFSPGYNQHRDYANPRFSPQHHEMNRQPRGHPSVYSQPTRSGQPSFGQPSTYLEMQNPSSFGRPMPRQRELYDPNRGGKSNSYSDTRASQRLSSVSFVRTLIDVQIPRIQLTSHDLAVKESLKTKLERLCQDAIMAHEKANGNPRFEGNSVELRPFGSLASGFGTGSSDMDLMLLSPSSRTDPKDPASEIPRLIEQALLEAGYGARLLSRTRIPIVKFCEQPGDKLRSALAEARKEADERLEKERQAEELKQSQKLSGGSDKNNNSANEPYSDNDPDTSRSTIQEPTKLPASKKSKHPRANLVVEKKDLRASKPEKAETTLENSLSDKKAIETSAEDRKLAFFKHLGKLDTSQYDDETLAGHLKLAMSEKWFSDEERANIRLFLQVMESRDSTSATVRMDEARSKLSDLPNVLSRYHERKPSPLDFPKTGVGEQFDINFSNHLALHNTHLLHCYSLFDRRIWEMVIFVKAWAKKRKINSTYQGTLSSYAYVLMVLHFVVNVVRPPLAPNLQLLEDIWPQRRRLSVTNINVEGHTVKFWSSTNEITEAVWNGSFPQNQQDTGELLVDFFTYFAALHPTPTGAVFHWNEEVLSLRTPGGILTKHQKGWVSATTETKDSGGAGEREVRNNAFVRIEDPFELDHNVGRPVSYNGYNKIRDEFRRAARTIEGVHRSACNTVDLFEEGSDPPPKYRLFGPNPYPYHPSGPTTQHVRNKSDSQADGVRRLNPSIPAPSMSKLDASMATLGVTEHQSVPHTAAPVARPRTPPHLRVARPRKVENIEPVAAQPSPAESRSRTMAEPSEPPITARPNRLERPPAKQGIEKVGNEEVHETTQAPKARGRKRGGKGKRWTTLNMNG